MTKISRTTDMTQGSEMRHIIMFSLPFLGRIGDHYRLGWKEADDARPIPNSPMLGEGPTHELPPGGLDYLNSEGPNGK